MARENRKPVLVKYSRNSGRLFVKLLYEHERPLKRYKRSFIFSFLNMALHFCFFAVLRYYIRERNKPI